jgi:uncharacterized ion transporter superfamily protein YfcC
MTAFAVFYDPVSYSANAIDDFPCPLRLGLAVLSIPNLAFLLDFAGVSRDRVVTAFQIAIGVTNLVAQVFVIVVGERVIECVP